MIKMAKTNNPEYKIGEPAICHTFVDTAGAPLGGEDLKDPEVGSWSADTLGSKKCQ